MIVGPAVAMAGESPVRVEVLEATRTGGTVNVQMRVYEKSLGKEESLASAPKVQLLEGQTGQVEVGQQIPVEVPAGKGTNAKPTIKYVMTGTRIDVVSVKGKDELLVVTSFVEKGATVWADAKVTKVKVLSEATKNP